MSLRSASVCAGFLLLLGACGGGSSGGDTDTDTDAASNTNAVDDDNAGPTGDDDDNDAASDTTDPPDDDDDSPPPDFPSGPDLPSPGVPGDDCEVPAEAGLEDTSTPTTVVGNGTPESCTGEAFVTAVAGGGVITFDCGPDPVTIELDRTAKVFNDTGPEIVIDGGGLVTLSGGGQTRILYMNTCDEAQVWTTPNCDNQDHPRLTVQNLTFVGGNSKSETEFDGGGAIWARGGRLKIVNSSFLGNVCAEEGPDVGGGAVRAFDQFNGQPLYVVQSTFGGEAGQGNVCANGGALSSIGVSWTIINSLFTDNSTTGIGGNPAQQGTPGGGSGGAIYNDGNTMTLSICGSIIERNRVEQHGSAIFFVSNDRSGDVRIDYSTITNNMGGSWYPTYPQISGHAETPIVVNESIIE